MKDQSQIPEMFLRSFVMHLIAAAWKPGHYSLEQRILPEESTKEVPLEKIEFETRAENSKLNPRIEPESEYETVWMTQQNTDIVEIGEPRENLPVKPIQRPIKPTPKIYPKSGMNRERQPPPKPIPIVQPKPGFIDLGKLNFLIIDPWVQTIECHGPDKNVTVRKGGRTLMTPVTLTEQEIRNVIESFSRETKIPLIEGILKTAYENLLITAIVSEYVGGRFIIQKINPQQFTVQR